MTTRDGEEAQELTAHRGYIPCPPAYLQYLRKLCTTHGILLVVDEVQSGFGRTGKLFAFQHCTDLVPDIVTFGKGCANGYPLSGMIANKESMDKWIRAVW